ncbi:PDR/VanB family oxidoreductase [Caenimonas koreensis]|uniref:2Fe-2S iron-sulfur cluster binding domain-containing protein n=1 Tax=Caenimonas koreensis DSM 17982 TaxID=1121255 RepID=A0A844B3Z7_9BURK|nr:PDR/VanB family oxidoreductase [Caenimonas koreensis]MRD47943.1 2Fe-2S iron-sulfur cluster binding domain-containing protein [Caenimonas koreensis DSM 17982]
MSVALPEALIDVEAAAAPLLRLRVQAIRMQAEGIHAFELVDADGTELPPVAAGAHVDVHLRGGLVRSYSLAGDPADRTTWTLGVLREANGQGGSKAMHESVRVGELLTVSHPRNAFALMPQAAHTVLLAGGVGITPIKAMAHALAAQGASFELHYCARTPRHAAFTRELQAIVPPGRLHFHFDNGVPGQGLDIAGVLLKQAGGAHLYYCGPAGFMKACAEASTHWSPGSVHFEHFKPPEPAPRAVADGSFEVRLARRGITLPVLPEQTIVRAIELAGFRVPTSCLSGLCGSCKVNYLEGEVEHNDYILSDEEKTRCLTLCVSRARSPMLVLDL